MADNVYIDSGSNTLIGTDQVTINGSDVHIQYVKLLSAIDGSTIGISGTSFGIASDIMRMPGVNITGHSSMNWPYNTPANVSGSNLYVNLRDYAANGVTSTIAGAKRGLDINIINLYAENDTSSLITGIALLAEGPSNTLKVLQVDSNGYLVITGVIQSIQNGTWNVGINAGDNTIGRVKLTDGTTVASIRDLASNDALNVAIVDSAGDQITTFGGGTQYQEGSTAASATGTVFLAEAPTNIMNPLQLNASNHLIITGNVNLIGGSASDGAIVDGVSSSIKATVLDYASSNPLAVRLTDTAGDYVTAGGGTEYTEGDIDSSITGKAILGEGPSNTLKPVQLDINNYLIVTGVTQSIQNGTWTVTANAGTGSFTVDSELPAAAVLADGAANPTTPTVGTAILEFNGTTWDRARGDTTNGLDVDVTRVGGIVNVTGNIRLYDSIGSGLTSTGIGAARGLDVNIISGNNILLKSQAWPFSSATVSAFCTHDFQYSNSSAGSIDQFCAIGGTDGSTYRAARFNSNGALQVDFSYQTSTPAFSLSNISAVTQGSLTSLYVALTTGLGVYREGATVPSITGVAMLGEGASDVLRPLQLDSNNYLIVTGAVRAIQNGTWTVDLNTGDNTVGRFKLTDGTTVASVRDLASNDALNVAIVDAAGGQITSFGGGTEYTEGDVDTTIVGGAVLGEAPSNILKPLQLDANNYLIVTGVVQAIQNGTWNIGTVSNLTDITDQAYPFTTPANVSGNNLFVSITGGQTTHDNGITGNPVRIGARARTSDYTALANDDAADLVTTTLGKVIVHPYCLPQNTINSGWRGILDSGYYNVMNAPGAGIRNYITTLSVVNMSYSVGTEVVLYDGNNIIWSTYACEGGGGGITTFPVPLRVSANISVTGRCLTSGANVNISINGYTAGE